jgi:hypothetical protein
MFSELIISEILILNHLKLFTAMWQYRIPILSDSYWLQISVGSFITAIHSTHMCSKAAAAAAGNDKQLSDKIWTL